MNNSTNPTMPNMSIEQAKILAKRLRTQLEKDGQTISHSKSLELLAVQNGFRDWNTMYASFGNQAQTTTPLSVDAKVSGQYLGHDFTATVLGVQSKNGGSRYKVSLDLDEAVDVVSFDSFSCFRKRINATINQNGITSEKNSLGVPILKINL